MSITADITPFGPLPSPKDVEEGRPFGPQGPYIRRRLAAPFTLEVQLPYDTRWTLGPEGEMNIDFMLALMDKFISSYIEAAIARRSA